MEPPDLTCTELLCMALRHIPPAEYAVKEWTRRNDSGRPIMSRQFIDACLISNQQHAATLTLCTAKVGGVRSACLGSLA